MTSRKRAENDDDEERAREHGGDKSTGKGFSETLGRAFLFLRLGDKLHDAGERVVARETGHSNIEGVVLIDGAGEDFIPGLAVHRHTLAGDGALIDAALAGDDDAVDGDSLAGLHDDDLVHREFFDRYLFESVLPFREGGSGHQLAECANRVARPLHRVVLTGMAEGKEKKQKGALGPLAKNRRTRRCRDHEQVDIEFSPHESRHSLATS